VESIYNQPIIVIIFVITYYKGHVPTSIPFYKAASINNNFFLLFLPDQSSNKLSEKIRLKFPFQLRQDFDHHFKLTKPTAARICTPYLLRKGVILPRDKMESKRKFLFWATYVVKNIFKGCKFDKIL